MKPILLMTLLILPSFALSAEPCGPVFGPSPPGYCAPNEPAPAPPPPVSPAPPAPTLHQLCLGSAACVPVRYVAIYPDGDETHDWFQHAYSAVDDYPVTG
jgi:hypothetical protein